MYRSTRNSNNRVTASQAVLQGLSADGGLFVPETIPVLTKSMDELSTMNYRELAYEVMKHFLTDYTEEELKDSNNSTINFIYTSLKEYSNIIIKYGRYIPNQKPHYDEVLGIMLASSNQYAKRLDNEN